MLPFHIWKQKLFKTKTFEKTCMQLAKTFPEIISKITYDICSKINCRVCGLKRLMITLVFLVFFSYKLMKGKALRKHSLHEKTAASVLLKLFISGNE